MNLCNISHEALIDILEQACSLSIKKVWHTDITDITVYFVDCPEIDNKIIVHNNGRIEINSYLDVEDPDSTKPTLRGIKSRFPSVNIKIKKIDNRYAAHTLLLLHDESEVLRDSIYAMKALYKKYNKNNNV